MLFSDSSFLEADRRLTYFSPLFCLFLDRIENNIIKHKIKETHTYYNRPIMKLAFLSTLLR